MSIKTSLPFNFDAQVLIKLFLTAMQFEYLKKAIITTLSLFMKMFFVCYDQFYKI